MTRIIRRLGLLVALAVTLMAIVSASAFATTITSNGSPYSGPIEADGGFAYFDNRSVWWYCGSTDLSGSIESDGSGQITNWTFQGCREGQGENLMGVSVENLPYDFQVEHTSGDAGTLTVTSPVTMNVNGWAFGSGGCSAGSPCG